MKKLSSSQLALFIDHTFLKPDGASGAVRKLCREAAAYGFASVCVNPCEVARAAKLLKGTRVKTCSVVGFPLGQCCAATKAFEAARAVQDGAQELDFVVNVRLLKAAARGGRSALNELRRELELCVSSAGGAVTKLIIECCFLTDDEKVFACRLAKEAGFDFVKTSTGFGPGGATVSDVKLMRRTVGAEMGVKAAGGIRTLADALAMIGAGASRLGCSAGVAIMEEFKARG